MNTAKERMHVERINCRTQLVRKVRAQRCANAFRRVLLDASATHNTCCRSQPGKHNTMSAHLEQDV